jgi:hypothetical protein
MTWKEEGERNGRMGDWRGSGMGGRVDLMGSGVLGLIERTDRLA